MDRISMVQMDRGQGEQRMRRLIDAQVARLVDADMDPAEAQRIVERQARVAGPLPEGLWARDNTPESNRALRERIAKGKADDARMDGFAEDYNAATREPKRKPDIEVASGDGFKGGVLRPQANVPWSGVVAGREAERANAREQLAGQADALRRGDEAARARGYKSQQHQQDATLESKTVGGRDILRGQWVDTMSARFGMPPSHFDALYDQFAEGKTHQETVKAIVGTGALRELRSAKNYEGPKASLADRKAAVEANAKQYNEARKLAGPQGRAMMANTILGAQTPEDLQKAMLAAHALDPNAGWGNAGVLQGQANADARAVANAQGNAGGPLDRMAADRAKIDQMPLGRERLNGYREMYRASVPPGQPRSMDEENAYVVNNGAQGASEAAMAAVAGNQTPEAMAFLQEWTQSYVASGAGTGTRSYEGWIRKLGIPKSEESMALYHKMTGVNPGGKLWERPAEFLHGVTGWDVFNAVPSHAEAAGQGKK
jgi:hypothetical protein